MHHAVVYTSSGITVAVLLGLFGIIFWLICYAIIAYPLSRLFKKAGGRQWAAWVPVYNLWKLLEMGGQEGFWAIIAYIPVFGIIALVFIYLAAYEIGKKLGKEGWFVLLAIFVPLVWLIWLAFDDSKWPKNLKKSPRRVKK